MVGAAARVVARAILNIFHGGSAHLNQPKGRRDDCGKFAPSRTQSPSPYSSASAPAKIPKPAVPWIRINLVAWIRIAAPKFAKSAGWYLGIRMAPVGYVHEPSRTITQSPAPLRSAFTGLPEPSNNPPRLSGASCLILPCNGMKPPFFKHIEP